LWFKPLGGKTFGKSKIQQQIATVHKAGMVARKRMASSRKIEWTGPSFEAKQGTPALNLAFALASAPISPLSSGAWFERQIDALTPPVPYGGGLPGRCNKV
jgi:hypothetical protein